MAFAVTLTDADAYEVVIGTIRQNFERVFGVVNAVGYANSRPTFFRALGMPRPDIIALHPPLLLDPSAGTITTGTTYVTNSALNTADNRRPSFGALGNAAATEDTRLIEYAKAFARPFVGIFEDRGVAHTVNFNAMIPGVSAQATLKAVCDELNKIVTLWNNSTNVLAIQRVTAGNADSAWPKLAPFLTIP